MASLKLNEWKGRWSFARGATKATDQTKGRAMTELTEALAEVDGLLAGINYLEKVEPDSEETSPIYASTETSNHYSSSKPATASWFGHLADDLPQLGASGSEDLSKIEPRHLRSILTGKLVNSNDEIRQIPHKSQWATIQSLRSASMLHYNQFAKVTADSTNLNIRKLRKSYVTAKKLLEMGILTFRQVLLRQNPSTLVDIFAFASLSYVISKTLHAKGHIDESHILSGILDWRAAITDERERSAFDEIAEHLWPEAKEIMHFIPLEMAERNLETGGLRHDENETRYAPFLIPEEATDRSSFRPDKGNIASGDDPPLSPWTQTDASDLQASTFELPFLSEVETPPGGLQNHVAQLTQETRSYPEFTFSDWLNIESAFLEESLEQNFFQNLAPDIDPELITPWQTTCVIEAEVPPTDQTSSSHGLKEPFPEEQTDLPADDSMVHRLLDTPLFQVVFRFLIGWFLHLLLLFISLIVFPEISEMGDLLNVLSGGGLTSGNDEIMPSHSRPPWATSEFLEQASEHFLRPLQNEVVQINGIFSGIIAMAEMLVKLGSFQTVREVENYIITVGRVSFHSLCMSSLNSRLILLLLQNLAHSYHLFATLVSKTLIQCLFASQKMGWNLLYPNFVQETDEYSIPYVNRRQRDEEEWAHSGFERQSPSDESSSPTSLNNENSKKQSPDPLKQHVPDSAAKLRYVDLKRICSSTNSSVVETSRALLLKVRLQVLTLRLLSIALLKTASSTLLAQALQAISLVMSGLSIGKKRASNVQSVARRRIAETISVNIFSSFIGIIHYPIGLQIENGVSMMRDVLPRSRSYRWPFPCAICPSLLAPGQCQLLFYLSPHVS